MKTFQLRILSVEVRNDAGRKVAVEHVGVTVRAETPQHAVALIGASLSEMLAEGYGRVQEKARLATLAQNQMMIGGMGAAPTGAPPERDPHSSLVEEGYVLR